MRDLQTLYWIGKYLYHVEDAADLVEHGVFTKEEYKTFQKAEAFLWNVRVHLHYLVGRAEERLSFDVQPALAAALGYHDAEKPRRAVEAFMRAYFLVAKDVGDLTRIFCAALEEQNKKPRPSLKRMLPGFLKPRETGDDFYVENGRLTADPAIFRQDPVNILRIFQIADAKQVDIHPDALRTITRSLDLITDEVRENPEANSAFLDMLTSRHNPERALRLMNEAGVLGRFIPEFGHAVGLMQFNMYHHYTVDEHLIRAVGNVAAIERGEHQDDNPLSTEIVKRIQSRAVLYCAMLLHDMAKGLPGDHSDVGAEIARSLCPRLGMSRDDTDAVAWLVKNHLVMSDTAQRRDVSDPQTVRDFVAQVQSPEMLRLLLVLTVADIRAVGPGRVERLEGPVAARALLRRRADDDGRRSGAGARRPRGREAKRRRGARLTDFTPEQRERALTRHYDNYWLAFEERRAGAPCPPDDPGRCRRRIAGASGEHQQFPRRHRDHALHPGPSRPVLAIRGRHRHVGRLHRGRQGLHHHGRLRAGRVLGAGRRGRGLRRRGAAGLALRQTIRKNPARGNLAAPRIDGEEAAAHQGQRLQDPAQGAVRQ